MVRFEYVATPLEMVAVEPAVMAPPVPVLIVAVMVPEALVTTLPAESSTLTTGWVLSAEPLAAPEGWVVTTNWVAVPKVLGEKLALVPETVGALVVCAVRV